MLEQHVVIVIAWQYVQHMDTFSHTQACMVVYVVNNVIWQYIFHVETIYMNMKQWYIVDDLSNYGRVI